MRTAWDLPLPLTCEGRATAARTSSDCGTSNASNTGQVFSKYATQIPSEIAHVRNGLYNRPKKTEQKSIVWC